jgi:hypothetical protein
MFSANVGFWPPNIFPCPKYICREDYSSDFGLESETSIRVSIQRLRAKILAILSSHYLIYFWLIMR